MYLAMHNYVRVTIFLPTPFLQRGIISTFSWYLAWTTYEVEHLYGLSSRGYFLGIWRSNFSIFIFMRNSPTRE